MKKDKRKGKGSFITWFKLGLLGVMAVGAASLYTPYPTELLRELRCSVCKPEPTSATDEAEVAPPVSATPDTTPKQENTGLCAIPTTPWKPDTRFTTTKITLPPFPPALPERVEPGNYEHINSMARGIDICSNVHFHEGTTATQDRKKKQAFQVKVSLELFLPHAAEGDELLLANPNLKNVLPGFDALMKNARVSLWFNSLYLHKQNRLRKTAATLTRLLDRHNFYDTDTILELSDPNTHRKVLWIQADMDVVSDGSDGDRLPTMPKKIRDSEHYQPSTSYRWRKKTKTPNPLLSAWEERLQKYKKNKDKAGEERATRIIADLKLFSFLLAEYDPFIVVPLTVNEGENADYRPVAGDYAVVIVDNQVYPAIVGDFGPRYKTGEASLRLCKTINKNAGINSRPVSDLKASYIIFPGTKEPENGPIDYERLNSRCRELLSEIGGISEQAVFVEMKDLLPQPKPEEPKQ